MLDAAIITSTLTTVTDIVKEVLPLGLGLMGTFLGVRAIPRIVHMFF